MKNKRILFITPFVPYPLVTGARIRTNSFVESVFEGNELFLIFGGREGSGEGVPEIKKYFKKAWCINAAKGAQSGLNLLVLKLKLIIGFFMLRSWQEQEQNPEMERKIIEVIEQERIDVVFCRYISMGKYLLKNKHIGSKVIVDLDDIEPLKNDREINAYEKPGSYGYYRSKLNNWMFARYFRKLSAVDVVLVCSQADADYVKEQRWAGRVEAISNSIDVRKHTGVGPLTKDIHAQKIILCCAHLGYGANVHGLVWFIEKVWPGILKHEPSTRFYMVGRDPDPVLKGYVDNKNIFLAANVESVLPYYQQASVTVTPLFLGGGTRLKILESFACHRPVISTTIGAEGLDMNSGHECLIADNAHGFALACLEILGDFELAKRLEEKGFEHIRTNYDLPVIKNRIRSLFDSLAETAK